MLQLSYAGYSNLAAAAAVLEKSASAKVRSFSYPADTMTPTFAEPVNEKAARSAAVQIPCVLGRRGPINFDCILYNP